MKTKEESNALKEEVEAVRGKLAELTDEELAKVSGGNEVTLTDEMIKEGTYLVGQADVIIYNEKRYYNKHESVCINRIDMFVYKTDNDATLLIPFFNYS